MNNVKLLLKKEIKLAISPWTYMFFLCAAMLLIPSYPYWVAFFYCLMTVQINFSLARSNNDNGFTASLPVKRSDIVLAKILSITFIEALQLIVAIPLAFVSNLIVLPSTATDGVIGNVVGLDANMSLFGFVIIAYGIFNLIFISQYFKTGYKMGVYLLLAMLAWFGFAGAVEIVLNLVPNAMPLFDGTSADTVIYRIITLVAGIGIYAGLSVLCYKRAVKNFENVGL